MKRSHRNKSKNKWKKNGSNKKHPLNNENRGASAEEKNISQQIKNGNAESQINDKPETDDTEKSVVHEDHKRLSPIKSESESEFQPLTNFNNYPEPVQASSEQHKPEPIPQLQSENNDTTADNSSIDINKEPELPEYNICTEDIKTDSSNIQQPDNDGETRFLKEDWLLLRMRRAGRNYVCKNNRDINIKLGDICVVDLGRAEDYAKVLDVYTPTEEEIKNSITKKIKRLLNDKDRQRIEDNKSKEEYAYQKCLRRISDHKLSMKLVGVEYSLDCSRILFYFTADGRIDFRELVKSLASEFRARIELRQIGVRDESKMLGGIGCCGRQLCCSTFLYDFEPINIRMAKIQRLPLNPSKISGLCGRLHCCLRYEYKFYRKASKGMPREGSLVSTKSGEGRIFDINIIKRTVFVFLENGKILEVPVNDIKILKEQKESEPDKKMIKNMLAEQHVDVQELKKLEDLPDSDIDDDDDDDDDDF